MGIYLMKKTIIFKLFKTIILLSVFTSWTLIFLQFFVEYNKSKEMVLEELKKITISFEKGISEAIWSLNYRQ
jgi:hypothetical protein